MLFLTNIKDESTAQGNNIEKSRDTYADWFIYIDLFEIACVHLSVEHAKITRIWFLIVNQDLSRRRHHLQKVSIVEGRKSLFCKALDVILSLWVVWVVKFVKCRQNFETVGRFVGVRGIVLIPQNCETEFVSLIARSGDVIVQIWATSKCLKLQARLGDVKGLLSSFERIIDFAVDRVEVTYRLGWETTVGNDANWCSAVE